MSGPVTAWISSGVDLGLAAAAALRLRAPQRAEREGAEHRHRPAFGGPAEAAAEQGAGDRADAADLGAAEPADLVAAQEVLGLVGEAAGAGPAPPSAP